MKVPLIAKDTYLQVIGDKVVVTKSGSEISSSFRSISVFKAFLNDRAFLDGVSPGFGVVPEYLPVPPVCANNEMFFVDVSNLRTNAAMQASYSIEVDSTTLQVNLYRNGYDTGVRFSPVDVFNLFTGEAITHPDDLSIKSLADRRYIKLREQHWSPAVVEAKTPEVVKLVENQPESEYVWLDLPAEGASAEELPICVICGSYIKDVKEQETLKWTNNKGDEISWNDREGLLTVRMNGSTELVNAKSFDEAVDFLFKARRCHVKKSRK